MSELSELIEQYELARARGFDRSTLRITHTNWLEQLSHAQTRLTWLRRAFEIRDKAGLPRGVEVGWTADPSSARMVDTLQDEINRVESEIIHIEAELGRPR